MSVSYTHLDVYKRQVKAVLQETPDLDVEALLKAALKKMF